MKKGVYPQPDRDALVSHNKPTRLCAMLSIAYKLIVYFLIFCILFVKLFFSIDIEIK